MTFMVAYFLCAILHFDIVRFVFMLLACFFSLVIG